MLKNYMEVVVENYLPDILKEYEGICKCESCIEDIKAIVLNNLKPMYVVSDKGCLYTKVNELMIQFKTDVIKEITSGIEKVSKNPHHQMEHKLHKLD